MQSYEDTSMKTSASIEYHPSETSKEEAMSRVEYIAFQQIIAKIRNKEFKYLKISTSVTRLFDYEDLSKAMCSIELKE